MMTTPYGLRVVGHRASERRVVEHARALAAYAALDPRADTDRESYLTHFVFPADLRRHVEATGSEAGYTGPCGADWLYWDFGRPNDLPAALRIARRLAGAILDRYRDLDDDGLLIFLSGGKGLHVGIPCSLWRPAPSTEFHNVAKRFALAHAEWAGVATDPMIYSKTRLFRAPNSRHPKTGLQAPADAGRADGPAPGSDHRPGSHTRSVRHSHTDRPKRDRGRRLAGRGRSGGTPGRGSPSTLP
jgi:hypothetical protein